MVKVYAISKRDYKDIPEFQPSKKCFNEDNFINIAEEQGLIWSLEGFQLQANLGQIDLTKLIIYIDINEE